MSAGNTCRPCARPVSRPALRPTCWPRWRSRSICRNVLGRNLLAEPARGSVFRAWRSSEHGNADDPFRDRDARPDRVTRPRRCAGVRVDGVHERHHTADPVCAQAGQGSRDRAEAGTRDTAAGTARPSRRCGAIPGSRPPPRLRRRPALPGAMGHRPSWLGLCRPARRQPRPARLPSSRLREPGTARGPSLPSVGTGPSPQPRNAPRPALSAALRMRSARGSTGDHPFPRGRRPRTR